MAKTKEQLNELKKEYETLMTKLNELTDEEIKKIIGGNNELGIRIIPCRYDTNKSCPYFLSKGCQFPDKTCTIKDLDKKYDEL